MLDVTKRWQARGEFIGEASRNSSISFVVVGVANLLLVPLHTRAYTDVGMPHFPLKT
jgi:hypothetical protein